MPSRPSASRRSRSDGQRARCACPRIWAAGIPPISTHTRCVRTRWDDALQAETRRGKTDLLRAHDAAFVAQLERERGPITPEHYARLIVASERAERTPALAGVELPEAAVMPVERVMSARMRRDAKLMANVLGAVEAARGA